MRGGVVAAGVVLMIFGAILFFEYPITSSSNGSNPFGDLFIGPIIGFIGFILLIAGLAASPNVPPTVIQYPAPTPAYSSPTPPPSQRYVATNPPPPDPTSAVVPRSAPELSDEDKGGFCPYCGKAAQPGYKFCRSCGHALDE